jgi:hypothetical protein
MQNRKDYLLIIQAVVARMANNSFLLKGWAVTLTAALFALAAKDANPFYFFVALFPVGIFWLLDAYYLLQERLFRHLYDRARMLAEDEVDFSLDTSLVRKKEPYVYPLWDHLLLLFYGPVLASILVVTTFFSWREEPNSPPKQSAPASTTGQLRPFSDVTYSVHWFTAESDHAFIFNIHVMETNPENPNKPGRVYVDPIGEKVAGGLIKAPKITYGKANQLYG